jgi:polyisoprenyl-phosphate glycosyltransferase
MAAKREEKTRKSKSHGSEGEFLLSGIPMRVSVVTPLFNEVGNLAALSRRLESVFEQESSYDWEWIAVDDGSRDGSREWLEAHPMRNEARLIWLSRNFGQQAALMAGLRHATGDAVIFLDGDLQDPPEAIPQLLRKWEEGAQVVIAQRAKRSERMSRRILIRLFHYLFGQLTGNLLPKDSGNFGLIDVRVAEVLRGMTEHSLYLPGLRAWAGFAQATITYDRQDRETGSGLSLLRLFGSAWDAIVAFSDLPLRLIAALGVLISLGSFGYGSVLLVERILQFFGLFSGQEVLGFTTVAVSVFFMGGVQLICLGVMGEYLAKIYREVKGRPLYLVESIQTKGGGMTQNGLGAKAAKD